MNINRITISSEDNPDWNGTWDKKSVVDSLLDIGTGMLEIGVTKAETRWVEYVFDMALGCECPDEIVRTFIECDCLKSIVLKLPSGTAKVTKF